MKIKNCFCLLFLLVYPFIESTAQKGKELDKLLKETFWTNCPKEFKVTDVPKKWENESAVILAIQYEYTLQAEGRWLVLKQNFHFRIKLNDKASISDYSELNFDKNKVSTRSSGTASSYKNIGIKIVKANGTEKELDLTKSVSSDYNSNSDNKIAVPDLEPGDILDYFIAVKKDFDLNAIFYSDMVESELLENKYPIVYHSIFYILPHKYNLFNYSYNGAPGFKEDRTMDNASFKLVDTMRAKSLDILWNYPYRTSPEIRYRISTDNFFDFQRLMDYKNYAYFPGLALVEDFMNKNFKNSEDTLQIINELFLMFRNPIYLSYFSTGYPLYEPLNYSHIEKNITMYISDYLTKKKIPHDVIIAPSRSTGPFEKQIDLSNCEYIIKIKKPKLMYLALPIPFRLPNEIPYIYEGMESSVSEVRRLSSYTRLPNEVLPVSKPENNITMTKMELALDAADGTKVTVKRGHVVKGNNKNYHQYLIYTNYDYLKEYDQPKYEKYGSVAIGSLVSRYKDERKKFEQRLTQDYLERDKKILNSIESEMELKISDYKNLKIKSIGMWPESPNTEYSDEFTIDNMVKKVGQNYLIDFGKLIERQTEVKDTARFRKIDIYMNYPRSYEEEFIFTLPEGYSVEGLENFNKYAINKTGGFVSSAEVKEGKLIVKTRKYFNEIYYPAKKWSELLKFLDASVEYYNTKLLLRKN